MTLPANPQSPARHLLVSIHDVSPAFEDRIHRILSLLEARQIRRGSLLVVPNYHGEWPIEAFPSFAGTVRELVLEGWEAILHGFTHEDLAPASGRGIAERLAARHLTDREGEFLTLDDSQVKNRLSRGAELLTEVLGRRPVGFVPPAWLRRTNLAGLLRENGFLYTEGHLSIEDLTTGRRRLSPVLAWASRSGARRLSSRIWAGLATGCLTRLSVVRVALHPGDFDHPDLIDSIQHTLDRLQLAGFECRTYADLLVPG